MAGQGPYNPNGGGMAPGQMPPGMMPGMSPPQQQQQPQMMMQKPIKRGTSRAVPIVVSAGLAVGVFCGLLFGVGVDKGEAAPPSTSHPMKKADGTDDVPAALQPTVNDGPKKEPAKAAGSGSGSAAVATTGTGSGSGSGSAAPAVAGSGSGSAAVVPAVTKPKLVVEISPDTIASGAKILVDGKEITGTSLEYEVDPATHKAKTATVVVTVKAQGYKDAEQKVPLDGDTTVKFEMVKGKSTLPKEVAVAAGSGSAAPATTPPATQVAAKPPVTTPPAQVAAKPPVTTPPGQVAAKPPVTTPPATTPPAGTGSAAKPPVHHHTPPGNGSAKKPGGLIDI